MNIAITTKGFHVDEFPDEWQVTRNPWGRKLTESEVCEFLAASRPAGIIAGVEPLTRRVFEACPSLAVISRCGAGLDSVDLDAASELGIAVRSTPDAPVPSVAEHAITLMLCLIKRIAECDDAVRLGSTEKPACRMFSGKTVGIVGCGRIGTRVAELAGAFGCRVIGHDPFLDTHPHIELTTLDGLLTQADIVSIHVPLTDKTKRLIDAVAINRMPEHAILVNTARGGIVDEAALYQALREHRIAGAGLDVFEQEPYEGPLNRLGPRVVLTPHVASSSVETRLAMEREAIANLVVGLREYQRSGDHRLGADASTHGT